ncbi:carboxylesterase [Phellopilus nigrolimitatus]|nr:carboxylesterase [Phellopilus nigrolimitatus]
MATHLSEELEKNSERVRVETRFGIVTGGRATNGAVVFLELPYALPPRRFENSVPLPADFRYDDKEYIHESSYGVQPSNNGQAAGIPAGDVLGLGQPTENPLFLNVVVPPSFDPTSSLAKFPVKVYIHGGFLQFGSPHGLASQNQYIAAERNEIHVSIGYRLSAFGFLACDDPRIEGNFGFKDQWLALQWIKENVSSFGGVPENIQVTGLSAGAHSVHQLLHYASHLPEGLEAPFRSAILHSNAIVIAPKTPSELRTQFTALCTALSIDPSSPDVLSTLQDPEKTPWYTITTAINNEKLGALGTFRGCRDGVWAPTAPDPMAWQRSGAFAAGLRRAGVQSVVVGDLSEEWYLYAIAHPIGCAADVRHNLLRYYAEETVDALLALYAPLPADAPQEACFARFGTVLSDGQVHLPVRMLARDLLASGFPVLRYEIRWTPEQVRERTKGYVTHGTDSVLWHYREPNLEEDQKLVARNWVRVVNEELRAVEEAGKALKDVKQVLTLREDRTIGWDEDRRFDEVMRLIKALPEAVL